MRRNSPEGAGPKGFEDAEHRGTPALRANSPRDVVKAWGARAHPKSVKCASATGTHGPSTFVRDALGRQPEAGPTSAREGPIWTTDGAYRCEPLGGQSELTVAANTTQNRP